MSFSVAQARSWSTVFPLLLPLGLRSKTAKAEAWRLESGTTPGDTAKAAVTKMNDPLFSPLPPIRLYRPHSNVEIAFDVRTRTPLYVLQRLSLRDGKQKKRRRHNFFEEASLPEHFRSRNSHYHLSGFDRGHVAAAADFLDEEHADARDSYNLINVAPQHPDLNRKLWAQLEEWTRNVARSCSKGKRSQQETYVVSGPLWLPKRKLGDRKFEYSFCGLGVPPSLLAVPTHFFKVVVVVESKNESPVDEKCGARIAKFACFVIPNDDSSCSASDLRDRPTLRDYVVCWKDLEAVSGLTFFPTLASDEWKAASNDAIDMLLRASRKRIGYGDHLLLLDDDTGSQRQGSVDRRSGSKGKKKKKWSNAISTSVQHLCREHSCTPPYNK